jgi:hypothetical protein
MLARLLAPAARTALPAMRAQGRRMTTKVDDMRLKDLPGHASSLAKDPQTQGALKVELYLRVVEPCMPMPFGCMQRTWDTTQPRSWRAYFPL